MEEISVKASQEFKLKKDLKKIENEWQGKKFTLIDWKNGGIPIQQGQSVEDVQTLLDEHVLTAQTIRSNPNVKFMEDKAEYWEKLQNFMQEVQEIWIKVQTNFQYLEPIFSSDDIQYHLKGEFNDFKNVKKTWIKIMSNQQKDSTATSIYEIKDLKKDLLNSLDKIEVIQKKLDDYLDKKRKVFARFYFLSNDEMLTILADSKDPTQVQPHLKKCFEGINEIIFTPDNEVIGMKSYEGEEIRFSSHKDSRIVPEHHKSAVEEWLLRIEEEMIKSMREKVGETFTDLAQNMRVRERWLKKWPGQCILTCSKISWTVMIEESISSYAKLREYSEELNELMEEVVTVVRGQLSNIERLTLGALIIIEVHQKDIVSYLLKNRVISKDDFEWTSHMRYYWDPINKNLDIKMVQTSLSYGFEYLGGISRLVITPLTDRCYRTLMSALDLNLGGAPEGPAGTGKTETVKDLAKAVAYFCLIFNCGKGLNAHAMEKFFRGLISAGAWSCFDEFNRIDLEVLSVIAQQIHQIQQAKATNKEEFDFQGIRVVMKGNCNIFITMNPGYAGRSELPDNLKSQFRPVAMMIPDYQIIGQISQYSMGFASAKKLSKKIVAVYKLCSEQLSTQFHYDYGMRAVKSVLIAAGALRRKFPDDTEEHIILQAIDDVNLPKFLDLDIPIFQSILSDLFPETKLEKRDYTEQNDAIGQVLRNENMIDHPDFRQKIQQLFDMIQTRHGLMLVGNCMAGKTSCYRVLAAALTECASQGVDKLI